MVTLKTESTRCKNKNYRMLGNWPLWKWSLEAIRPFVDDVFAFGTREALNGVDGFDDYIVEEAKLPRTNSNEICKEFCQKISCVDVVLWKSATHPFIFDDILAQIVNLEGKYDSAITVTPVTQCLWRVRRSLPQPLHDARVLGRTQDTGPLYAETYGVCYFHRSAGLDCRHTGLIPKLVVDETPDIDTEEDWQLCLQLLETDQFKETIPKRLKPAIQ